MGKHNGKARRKGLAVGKTLVNAAKKEGKNGGPASLLHTTDTTPAGNNMQSVIESNDLVEMMSMADLADREFAADKTTAVVVSSGTVAHIDTERAEKDRTAAEARHHLRIPRRPHWDTSTTPEQLDAAERALFLEWRRELAAIEQDELLTLTPFEKNLEVWRQLWRVLERSDIVVQVLDARDPLTYRSTDLEKYCRELNAAKSSLMLLNKADLLPENVRTAWADYFEEQGVDYLFWSARRATEAQQLEKEGLEPPIEYISDSRVRVLTGEELLDIFEQRAAVAVENAVRRGLPRTSRGDRYMIGLTGYPNVGKSSTINALFGSKKTAVAPTPGKTKHFQTLNMSDTLCLCDCPGLVMPRFARSKAEMVAAGVIPIDRLTDVKGPVGTVTKRVTRKQLENLYGVQFPKTTAADHVTAIELIAALAFSRGWLTASGAPDETKTGRKILKDYVDGKVLAWVPPPGSSDPRLFNGHEESVKKAKNGGGGVNGLRGNSSDEDGETSHEEEEEEELELDPADLELLADIEAEMGEGGQTGTKPTRPAYKFHGKKGSTKARGIVSVGGYL
jgi:large subunit GTPase 1